MAEALLKAGPPGSLHGEGISADTCGTLGARSARLAGTSVSVGESQGMLESV